MNNDEKILAMLNRLYARLDTIDRDLALVKDDVAEIKEHAEVTRSATNSLVEWADTVGVITQVKFPVKKAHNE